MVKIGRYATVFLWRINGSIQIISDSPASVSDSPWLLSISWEGSSSCSTTNNIITHSGIGLISLHSNKQHHYSLWYRPNITSLKQTTKATHAMALSKTEWWCLIHNNLDKQYKNTHTHVFVLFFAYMFFGYSSFSGKSTELFLKRKCDDCSEVGTD